MDAKLPNWLGRAVLLYGPGGALLLLLGALIIYVIAGLLGWSGSGQVMFALCAGPLIGFGLIGAIAWVAQRRQKPAEPPAPP